jgi:glucokinase
MKVIVGDIGGTHTRLAIADVGIGTVVRLSPVSRFLNHEIDGLDTLLHDYLSKQARAMPVCLAVAGPTEGQHVTLTNLNWKIDAHALSHKLGIQIRLINDFAAVGWGSNALNTADVHTLQAGQPNPEAPRVVLGAGTGLGVAVCVCHNGRYQPLPGEGGHIALAPVDAEQDALLAYLRSEYGRVSAERVLSGPGISALYRFECGRLNQTPAHDDPAQITTCALEESDVAAVTAVRLFARIYGQVAGDLALVAGARGGVYLAGGIAPQLLPLLQKEIAAQFVAKGRFSEWMRKIPLQIVLDPAIGLKGAALAATANTQG